MLAVMIREHLPFVLPCQVVSLEVPGMYMSESLSDIAYGSSSHTQLGLPHVRIVARILKSESTRAC